MTTIFIADDVEFGRLGLIGLIEKYVKDYSLDWQIVGQAATRDDTIAGLRQIRPDIVLLDLQMPNDRLDAQDRIQNDEAGFEVIRAIQDENLPTKVVVLTSLDSAAVFNRARELNVNGFVIKGESDDIRTAINRVLRGLTYIDPTPNPNPPVDPLTDREKEVLLWTAVGLTQKEIADRMEISERTAQAHMQSIYDKLNLRNQNRSSPASAVTEAIRFGSITARMIDKYRRMVP